MVHALSLHSSPTEWAARVASRGRTPRTQTSVVNQLAGLETPHTPSVGFQQVPVQGRYVLLRPPIHQKDPEPGDLLPVGFLRGEGRKQVNPNSYPTPQAHNLGGGPGTWAYATRHCGSRDHPPNETILHSASPGWGGDGTSRHSEQPVSRFPSCSSSWGECEHKGLGSC